MITNEKIYECIMTLIQFCVDNSTEDCDYSSAFECEIPINGHVIKAKFEFDIEEVE